MQNKHWIQLTWSTDISTRLYQAAGSSWKRIAAQEIHPGNDPPPADQLTSHFVTLRPSRWPSANKGTSWVTQMRLVEIHSSACKSHVNRCVTVRDLVLWRLSQTTHQLRICFNTVYQTQSHKNGQEWTVDISLMLNDGEILENHWRSWSFPFRKFRSPWTHGESTASPRWVHRDPHSGDAPPSPRRPWSRPVGRPPRGRRQSSPGSRGNPRGIPGARNDETYK